MRPPTSQSQSKNHYLNRIIVIGLFSGILITTLIWLRVPNQITAPLSWFSLGLIGLGSFLYLRQPTISRPRWVMVLAALAAVSLVFLFPELFGPACGGIPRAFASSSQGNCAVCTDYVCEWSNKLHDWHCFCDEWDNSGCVQDQPPTIQGTLSCSQWGQNGWCTGSLSLNLSAVEPQGQDVIISGDVNGTAFACPSSTGTSTCSIPLPQGSGTVNYIATSATGLTALDLSSYKFDNVQLQLDGWLNGTAGSNGWFISSVDVNASVSDPQPASGMAAFEYNLNSAGWESYKGPLNLSDGVHSLKLRASDIAGNTVETNQTIQIDTLTPTLDISVAGTAGTNGWYGSNLQINAAASDSGSGVSAFEYDLNGTGWTTYSDPLDLSDGTYSLSLRVIDNAGNMTEGTQTFLVDTLAPTIDLSVVGAEGSNGWNTTSVHINAAASDSGSGLSVLEVSVDNGDFENYSSPLVFDDGLHTYQFRAFDNAGNLVETTSQQLQVDTIPPVIDLPKSWSLGQATTFKVQDDGSGLANVRLVVEDEDERYPKVTWIEQLSSYKFKGEIDWNGRFKDGQLAPPGGEYYAWVKVRDAAGNESMQAGQIIVPVASIVEELLLSSEDQTDGLVSGTESSGTIEEQSVPQPPVSSNAPSSASTTTNSPPPISFGGDNNGAAQPSGAQAGRTSFNAGGLSNLPVSSSNPSSVLWGATATAALGAFVAEAARKKEAQEAARRAANRAVNQARKLKNQAYVFSQQLKKQQEAINQALQNKVAYARVLGRKEVGIEKELRSNLTRAQAEQEAFERTKQKAYDIYRAQEVASHKKIAPPKEAEKKWWEKPIDWVDHHQTEVSIGIGVAAGLLTTILVLTAATTAVVTLPVLLLAAGVAAVVAGASVTIGTGLLNNYYGRDLTTNLWSNLGAATTSAAITTGLGLFLFGGGLTSTLITVGNGATAVCANYQTLCNYVEPVMRGIDFLEETGLMVKGTIQTWRGDSVGALETMQELQMEYMDGGIPGNAIAREIGEEVSEWTTKYGDDVVDLVRLYGDDAVDLIRLHKGDAVKLIRNYGKEGIALLKAHGDDAINIVIKVERLSDDAFEKAWQQGPDAMKALSFWDEEDLIKYSDELVSRAPQDAVVLKAASKLAGMKNIDSDEAQELIKIIAENSIIGDGDRLILGKWVEGSLDAGFIGKARSENALFYGTNPGLQKIIDSMDNLSGSEKEKLFWAVNEQVLQKSIDRNWKIDYSFNGFDGDEIVNEIAAIEAIAGGKSRADVEKFFNGKFPFRMREIE
ncbi:MAG: Ig-like domain repeat protein, partial [Anaerolineales bacterium]